MKKILVFMLAVLLLALCGCQKSQPDTPTQSAPTQPATTVENPTEPALTGQAIPSQEKKVEGLVCTVTVDGQESKTVENPLASDLYYYLLACRKDAVEDTPPVTNDVAGISFSFQVDGRQSHRYWVYADGYAAIPTSNGANTYRYFKFPENSYIDLMATIG